MRRQLRRWLFWRLHHAVESLDGVVGWLDRQVDRIEPPFVPAPPPEPVYVNATQKAACGHTIMVPLVSTASDAVRNYYLSLAVEHHVGECAQVAAPALNVGEDGTPGLV